MTGVPPSGGAPVSWGALPETATLVGSVAAAADRVADQAAGLAETLTGQSTALLTALGGGPPAGLRESDRLATSASDSLAAAALALRDAASHLRAFAGRAT